MYSARHLMVFNICVKFHENMSSAFKLMQLTQKLLTDRHTQAHTHTWHTKQKNCLGTASNKITEGERGGLLCNISTKLASRSHKICCQEADHWDEITSKVKWHLE